ncbi:MAG: NAD(P)-binding protein [Novosphingobium sp.]
MLDPAPARPPGVIVVLGAGIAGLAAADRLCRAGWRVRVVERGADVGGFHRACHIGPYTFDAGSIFYEEHARLFDLAPGLRELCPKVNRHQRRIAPDGTIRHYPFTPDEFRGRPFAELVRALIDLLWSRLTVRRNGTVDAISRGWTRSRGWRFATWSRAAANVSGRPCASARAKGSPRSSRALWRTFPRAVSSSASGRNWSRCTARGPCSDYAPHRKHAVSKPW